jgi:hypothetical protein
MTVAFRQSSANHRVMADDRQRLTIPADWNADLVFARHTLRCARCRRFLLWQRHRRIYGHRRVGDPGE